MNLSLAKKLKESEFLFERCPFSFSSEWKEIVKDNLVRFTEPYTFENTKGKIETIKVGIWYWLPTLPKLIKEIKSMVNEFAMGWNDSGCFWHFQYGQRGSGNMMEGFGERYDALDADTLEDALAELWLKMKANEYKKDELFP